MNRKYEDLLISIVTTMLFICFTSGISQSYTQLLVIFLICFPFIYIGVNGVRNNQKEE